MKSPTPWRDIDETHGVFVNGFHFPSLSEGLEDCFDADDVGECYVAARVTHPLPSTAHLLEDWDASMACDMDGNGPQSMDYVPKPLVDTLDAALAAVSACLPDWYEGTDEIDLTDYPWEPDE